MVISLEYFIVLFVDEIIQVMKVQMLIVLPKVVRQLMLSFLAVNTYVSAVCYPRWERFVVE